MNVGLTMTKIDGVYTAKAALAAIRKKRIEGQDGFAALLTDSVANETAEIAVTASTPTPDIDLLLGLQTMIEPPIARSQRKEPEVYGKELLSSLQKLQQNMLLPGATTEQAEAMVQALLAEYPEAHDNPELEEALQALRLRAMVELAKREQAS